MKSDASEVEYRIDNIYQLKLQGWHNTKIVEYSIKTWGVKSAQAYKYIQKAQTLIEEIAAAQRQNGFDEMLSRHADMRSRAYKTGDLRLVLDIDREDSKLFGYYAPTKIAPTDPTGEKEYVAFTDEERAMRIKAILDGVVK